MASSRTQFIYPSRMPSLLGRIARMLRVRVVEREEWRRTSSIRASWGEIVFSPNRRSLGLGLTLIDWGDDDDDPHYSVNLVVPTLNIFVRVPQWLGLRPGKSDWRTEGYRKWGIQLGATDTEFPSQLCVSWGKRTKYIDLPWSTVLVRRSYLLKTGAWYHEQVGQREGDWRERARILENLNKYTERHPYCYVLESGEAQDTVADITVEEWETRRRWLRWTPFLATVRRSIDVKFANEIGEGVGDWKGGVVGTVHRMLPGELPVHTLARMQQERRFR